MVGFLVSTGVSLMMNGMCCVYQMHGEKELRMAMRQDIREEWKLQRQLEVEWQEEQRQQLERQVYQQQEEEQIVRQLRLQSMKQRYHLLHEQDQKMVQPKYSPKDLQNFPSFPSLIDDDEEEDEEMDC